MVNKDMNGFPVKKCSAFQFFKKRVRFSFNSFFLSFFFSFYYCCICYLARADRKSLKKEGALVSYCRESMAWAVLLNTKGSGSVGEEEPGRGAGAGGPKGITSALCAVECVPLSQLTPGLDATQPAIQAGIRLSKAECRDVAACL